MKPILPIIFLFISTISFYGCKKIKQNQIDATIYVKEYKTETPISNAKVLIMRGATGSGVGNSLVETLYTDSEGKVDYNNTIDQDYMYYAEAYKDKYFDTHNQQVSVTSGKKNFSTTIYMYAESYVKLHVKNINPFNQFDLIEFSSGCNPFLQGDLIDTSFFYCDNGDTLFRSNFIYGYSYTVTKNNTSNTTIFSFTPIPHDTINIMINY